MENIEIIKLLLAHPKIDVNLYSILKYDQIKNETPLHTAIKNKNIEIIKLLLSHPKIDVNMKLISIFCLNVIFNLLFHFKEIISIFILNGISNEIFQIQFCFCFFMIFEI